MDTKEASELKEYQRVMWDQNKYNLGTILCHNSAKTGILIEWDNIEVNGSWIDYEDMQKIERCK